MKFYNIFKTVESENKNEEEIDSNNKTDKRKKIVLIVSILSCLLVLSLIGTTLFGIINVTNNKIIKGVSIKGIDVSGLTIEEAEKKINEKMQEKYEKDIVIKKDDFEYSIKLSQIEANYDIKKAAQEAYNIGRCGNIFSNNFDTIKTMTNKKDLDLSYTYNEKLLKDIVSDISVKIPNAVVQSSYYIENNKLIINKGKPGNTINKEKTEEEITDIIKNRNENYNIELETIEIEPEDINIDKIHNEVYKEPKNASYKKDPFEIFPHENGIDFDTEAAKKIINDNKNKEEYEINLKIIEPEITTSEIGTEAFPDLLSSFSTKYDVSNAPRTNNLIIAMKKLDGVIVNPGETFSYNKTLGKRTAEAGYKEAGGFAGGRVVQTLAGGICQISSTLYDAAVYANLEIVERHNHMFLAGYVGAGKDATVVYGTYDFKFKNTRKYPVMIKTSIGSGVAKISIFGIKEDVEYEVEISTNVLSYIPFSVVYEDDYNMGEGQEKVIQNGMNGCKSITYKIVKLNGKQISSEVLSTDTYDAMNKIIKRGVKKAEQATEPPTIEESPQEEESEKEEEEEEKPETKQEEEENDNAQEKLQEEKADEE